MSIEGAQASATGAAPSRLGQARRLRSVSEFEENQSSGFAFGLFIIFVVFTLLSVASRISILGLIRPTVLFIALISLMIIFTSGVKRNRDTSRTTRLLIFFILYLVVSMPFVQWPGSVLRFGIEGFVKVAVFFFFAVQLVDTYRRLWIFVTTILVCQVFRVLEPLYLHLTTGYWGSHAYMSSGEFLDRLGGAPSDIINPNGLAFVVLTALPFLHYLLGGSSRFAAKVAYVVLGGLLLYAFMLTGSRSGMVGLVVLVVVIVLRSRHRALMLGGVTLAAVVSLSTMSDGMRERYLSLVDTDTQHSATREGRIEGMKSEFLVGVSRPIFGHGLGTSAEAKFNAIGNAQIAHNLYTEVFIETGAIGLVFMVAILMSILANVRSVGPAVARLRESVNKASDRGLQARMRYYTLCAEAVFAWVVMCLVFSLASYGLSEFYWYMTGGLSVALRNLVYAELGGIQKA